MSDTQETPQHLIWIKTLDDALLGIRVSLRILSEKLDMLHRLSDRHELQFDWEGKFLGMTRDSPAQSLLPNHSQCLDAKVSCPLFIKWAESLWESHHEAETALSEMPSWASETLNASAGQNWRAMVLRECLDRVLIWPNEKIHNLAAAKVSGDPTSLLDNTFNYEPYDDWQAMCVKLDEYRGDLVAIRYEGIQDPPPKPIPSEPTGNIEARAEGSQPTSEQPADSDSGTANTTKPPGPKVSSEEIKNRESVVGRWAKFKKDYKQLGYTKGTYRNAAEWMVDKKEDMGFLTKGLSDPTDYGKIGKEIKKMVRAHKETPDPNSGS